MADLLYEEHKNFAFTGKNNIYQPRVQEVGKHSFVKFSYLYLPTFVNLQKFSALTDSGNFGKCYSYRWMYPRFQWDRYTQLHSSFFHRRGRIAQSVSSLSSICIVFCFVVHELKQAGPLKSGISLLAWIYQRCILFWEIAIWNKIYHKIVFENFSPPLLFRTLVSKYRWLATWPTRPCWCPNPSVCVGHILFESTLTFGCTTVCLLIASENTLIKILDKK
jgi:hypothetical protein